MDLEDKYEELLKLRCTRSVVLPGGISQVTLAFWTAPTLPYRRDVITDRFVFMYLLSGNGRYRDSLGRNIELRPGVVLQRFAGVEHCIERFAGETWLEFAIHITDPLFSDLRNMGMVRDCSVFLPGVDAVMVSRCEELVRQLGDVDEAQMGAFLLMLQQLFVDIAARDASSAVDTDLVARLQASCRLLSDDLAVKLSMPAIAKQVGLGYHRFRKAFAENIGMAPKEYRVRRRIERAQGMILGGRHSLAEIAEELGYADLAAFAKQFKQVAGITPAAYRRSWQ